jgi:hypothetical protein
LDLYDLPALHTLSVPALTSLFQLSLWTLPALHALSFPGPLKSGANIAIRNTSLSQISGLSFPSTANIEISSNRNLRLVTFPFVTLASTPYSAGVSSISVHGNGNGDDFVLSLPKLRRVKGPVGPSSIGAAMHLYSVRRVDVPELQLVDGDLDIGAFSTRANSLYSNYSTALTDFSAPKLLKTGGSLKCWQQFSAGVYELPGSEDYRGRCEN